MATQFRKGCMTRFRYLQNDWILSRQTSYFKLIFRVCNTFTSSFVMKYISYSLQSFFLKNRLKVNFLSRLFFARLLFLPLKSCHSPSGSVGLVYCTRSTHNHIILLIQKLINFHRTQKTHGQTLGYYNPVLIPIQHHKIQLSFSTQVDSCGNTRFCLSQTVYLHSSRYIL